MKRNRILLAALAASIAATVFPNPALAEDLSREEIDQLKERLASLKQSINDRYSLMNQNAGDVFLSASQDPDKAVELYFKCHWVVNYEREGREEREFEDWKDNQRDRVKDPRFLEGLGVQLRWLALSCKAAEADDLEQVFPSLLSYGDGLMNLSEIPSQALLQDVSGSIFARAFQIENLLRKRENWELVPFNIAGIYEKTVMPYLRENDPGRLMTAWDRRIAHQTSMVEFFEALENRGNRRDDRRRSENEVRQMQGGRSGGIVRAHDRDDFLRDTLPKLRLGKLKDMFSYIDQAQGAAGLIDFIEENIEHEKAEDWLDEISETLTSGTKAAAPEPLPVPVSGPPPVTTGTTPPPTSPTSTDPPTTSGKVPPGLVPAN